MINGFRVMKADAIEPKDFKDLGYPLYASVKLDGIRCTVTSKEVLSSSNKSIPNNYVRQVLMDWMKSLHLNETLLDGELLVGNTFQSCSSGIMSVEGEPDFTYYVFDRIIFPDRASYYCTPFSARSSALEALPISSHIQILRQHYIDNEKELQAFYTQAINEGHEGIIIRSLDGPYKFGRATKNQGYMLKVKPFEDAEAVILSMEEGTTNLNEQYIDERGLVRRSHHQENKIPNGMLGRFKVRDCVSGIEFYIGSGEGLTHSLRQIIWSNPGAYIGKIIKYKTQKIGTKDKPRIPIFLGFREKEDM